MGKLLDLFRIQRFVVEIIIALEKMLQNCSGTYSFGNEITLADVYLVPQVYNANRFSVNMKEFPLISQITARLEVLEPFIAAHPSNQPDAKF
jgi:maleylacetoacetate isomerase